MKRFILFAFVMILSLTIVKAQEMDMITSKQAIDYFKSQGRDTLYAALQVQAMEIAGQPGLAINFANGTSTFWMIMSKSRDTSDHLGYIDVIYSIFGEMMLEPEFDDQIDFQTIQEIPLDFANSSETAKAIAKSTELTDFYNKNKDSLYMKQLSVILSPVDELLNWQCFYYVSEENNAGCIYDAYTLNNVGCTILATRIEEVAKKALKSFPNPANDFVTIELPISGNADVTVYNQLGNRVKDIKTHIDKFLNICISDLQNGIYTVRIMSGNNVYTQKIVVAR